MATTWPALLEARTHFIAGGAPGRGEAAPGDHLQTAYRLWLVGHQLERGAAPWRDPYNFQPEAKPTLNLGGWPFGLVFWPLERALGFLGAWNAFILLSFVAAGAGAYAWLRALELPVAAALVGGLAFSIAPYRAAQTAGHLLGPISVLVPLALWAFERGRRGGGLAWLGLATAALVSLPLSGQVHLALGAVPFFAFYALVRGGNRRVLAAALLGCAAAAAVGIGVQRGVIAGSVVGGGRSLDAVSAYSAEPADFLRRSKGHGLERFVFLGWVTPLLALAGLVVLARERRLRLAIVLGAGVLVPCLLALGTRLPLYSWVWHVLPPLRYARVPERLMPIACLALAGLVAVLAAGSRRALVPVLVAGLLLVDLHVRVFGSSGADGGNAAYAALRSRHGRLLELPVFLPDVHLGSVYDYYSTQAPRGRPAGYSTVAPLAADRLLRRLRRLGCGDWSGGADGALRSLGVRFLAVHRGLYAADPARASTAWFAWRELLRHGFRPVGTGGAVTMFERADGGRTAPAAVAGPREPADADAIACPEIAPDGELPSSHGALWMRGRAPRALAFLAEQPTRARVVLDGRVAVARTLAGSARVALRPRHEGWHLVTVDVLPPHTRGTRVTVRLTPPERP